jgi:hypothetical protein
MKKNNSTIRTIKDIVFYLVVAGAVIHLGTLFFYKYIKPIKIQQGYVNPSKLELKLGDVNRDGQKEVYLTYNKKSYLFTLDGRGKPLVQDYEVKPAKPAEIVPLR